MKVISLIEHPSVIRRILKNLDLWEDPRPPPEPLELVCEPCADCVPWQNDVPEIELDNNPRIRLKGKRTSVYRVSSAYLSATMFDRGFLR